MQSLLFLLSIGCTRDVVVGVENLPSEESFVMTMNGEPMVTRTSNVWVSPEASMREEHSLKLWYGERECSLSQDSVIGEIGFGELSHQSNWSCPGLLGYKMHLVGDLMVGESEVTVGLWQQIKGEDQEDICGSKCPKSNINWAQTLEFANQMSILEGLTQCYHNIDGKNIEAKEECDGYRLPTDTEWSGFSSLNKEMPYADSDFAPTVGWVKDNSDLLRHPVCNLDRNGYQLCDVTGNVWEWCWDTPERTELRKVRGGGFTSTEDVARLDNGVDFPAHLGAEHIGFRLVRAAHSRVE